MTISPSTSGTGVPWAPNVVVGRIVGRWCQRDTVPQPQKSELALTRAERIIAAGVVVSSLELLTRSRMYQDDGILSWSVAKTRNRWKTGKLQAVWELLFQCTGMRVILSARVTAACALASPTRSLTIRRLAGAYLAASGYMIALRAPYGGDGAEQMSILAMASIAAARIMPGGTRPALVFIASQSLLSYAVAGVAKIMSPMWMEGTAVRDVFRTRMFGAKSVFEMLKDRPRLCLLLSRSTAILELLAPLMLVLPKSAQQAYLVGLGLFHVGTAGVMGLNRFPLAFVGTYPTILWLADRIRSKRTAGIRS